MIILFLLLYIFGSLGICLYLLKSKSKVSFYFKYTLDYVYSRIGVWGLIIVPILIIIIYTVFFVALHIFFPYGYAITFANEMILGVFIGWPICIWVLCYKGKYNIDTSIKTASGHILEYQHEKERRDRAEARGDRISSSYHSMLMAEELAKAMKGDENHSQDTFGAQNYTKEENRKGSIVILFFIVFIATSMIYMFISCRINNSKFEPLNVSFRVNDKTNVSYNREKADGYTGFARLYPNTTEIIFHMEITNNTGIDIQSIFGQFDIIDNNNKIISNNIELENLNVGLNNIDIMLNMNINDDTTVLWNSNISNYSFIIRPNKFRINNSVVLIDDTKVQSIDFINKEIPEDYDYELNNNENTQTDETLQKIYKEYENDYSVLPNNIVNVENNYDDVEIYHNSQIYFCKEIIIDVNDSYENFVREYSNKLLNNGFEKLNDTCFRHNSKIIYFENVDIDVIEKESCCVGIYTFDE